MDEHKHWITTGPVDEDPRYLAGPFMSPNMAVQVRKVMETKGRRTDLWIVRNDVRQGEVVPTLVSRREYDAAFQRVRAGTR